MDFNKLTESEVFTPLKATPAFEIAQDEGDEEVLVKIPHGLTAKKENRRKSYHYDSMQNAKSPMTFSAKRVPLTAPRPNALNSRPISDYNNLERTKRSLMSDLNSMRGGKENDTPIIHKTMSPIQITDFEPIDSPEGARQKRRSTLTEVTEGTGSPKAKIQKIGEFLIDEVLEANDIQMDSNAASSDEELSRIEFAEKEASEENDDVESSFVVPTQEDLHQIDQESSMNPATPSRFTEPVAVSPKTEQINRVIDESALLLDTTKSPAADDSFVAESPLSQHSVSEKHTIEVDAFPDLGPIEEYEPSVSPQKHTHLASPNKKPFFTISQVHEIQADFKREVEKLEEHLKEKSVSIMELNDQVNQHKNKIYQLNDEIESLNLQKKQITKENELMVAEHKMFKDDIASIEATVKKQDDRLERNKYVIAKFKEKVKVLDAVIEQKNSEINDLQQEIKSKSTAIDVLNTRVSDYEAQAQRLAHSLKVESEKVTASTERCQELEAKISELVAKVEEITKDKESLTAEISEVQSALQLSKEKNAELSAKFDDDEEHLREAASRYEELNNQIELLKRTIVSMEAQLEEERQNASENILEVQSNFNATMKELNLKDAVIAGLQSAVGSLRGSYYEMQKTINIQESLLTQRQTDLNECNELLTIRKAEVDELNIEIKSAHKEMENLRRVVEEKNGEANELSNTLKEYVSALENKEAMIQKLDEAMQKQEAGHLAELEVFHAELSNAQIMASNKSHELFKIKEEKDALQREHELMKFEYQTMKDEAGDYDTRISNLKAKLQEYKSECQAAQDMVKRLEEEKVQLEKETDKRLQQLAEDLYIQYSKKHEQKVQVLKKGYESKWQGKVSKAEAESDKLRREIEGLNARLEKEIAEKNEVIKLWDNLKTKESTGEQ